MNSKGIENLGFLLHDAARLLRKRFEARGSEYGLSASQWRLLVRLVREESAPQARLAELLEIEPISVSRQLDRMEQGGWVVRRSAAEDRRVRLVYPTEQSRQVYATIKAMARDVYEQALSGVDEAGRRALIEGLEKVVDNLGADETCTGGRQNTGSEGVDR